MYSGFSASTRSGGITVAVILVPATGAMVFVKMFRFAPSIASVFANPKIPSFAALQRRQ